MTTRFFGRTAGRNGKCYSQLARKTVREKADYLRWGDEIHPQFTFRGAKAQANPLLITRAKQHQASGRDVALGRDGRPQPQAVAGDEVAMRCVPVLRLPRRGRLGHG